MSSEPDWYGILGVSPDATEGELRDCHRSLVSVFHPDQLAPRLRPFGGKRLTLINEAWEQLGDPAKRQAYDERRWQAARIPDASTVIAALSEVPPAFEQQRAGRSSAAQPMAANKNRLVQWAWATAVAAHRKLARLALQTGIVALALAALAWSASKQNDGWKLACVAIGCCCFALCGPRTSKSTGTYTNRGWRRRSRRRKV